jgi:hypothetical protein
MLDPSRRCKQRTSLVGRKHQLGQVLITRHQQCAGECFAILARATRMPKAEAEALKATAQFHIPTADFGSDRMVFVLKRTPAFQLFGPFQTRSQVEIWIKERVNKRRYACCFLQQIDPRHSLATRTFDPTDETAEASGGSTGSTTDQT